MPQWHLKDSVILPKVQVAVTPKHVYILDPKKSEWADYAVQAKRGNLSGKRVHTQLVRERSPAVVSVR